MPDKQCSTCKGTGKVRAVTQGRVSSYAPAEDECPKCGGEGVLRPVKVEGKPATITGEAKANG